MSLPAATPMAMRSTIVPLEEQTALEDKSTPLLEKALSIFVRQQMQW